MDDTRQPLSPAECAQLAWDAALAECVSVRADCTTLAANQHPPRRAAGQHMAQALWHLARAAHAASTARPDQRGLIARSLRSVTDAIRTFALVSGLGR